MLMVLEYNVMFVVMISGNKETCSVCNEGWKDARLNTCFRTGQCKTACKAGNSKTMDVKPGNFKTLSKAGWELYNAYRAGKLNTNLMSCNPEGNLNTRHGECVWLGTLREKTT